MDKKIKRESDEQIELISWWDEYAEKTGLSKNYLFHIPNGGSRHPAEAARLKREGVRKGTPDLFLTIPSGGYHGLFIELKRVKGGRITDEQVKFLQYAKSLHYAAFCCRGAEKAKQLILEYLLEPESLFSLTGTIIYDSQKGN